MKDIFDLIGRILLSFIFYFEAYNYFVYETLKKKAMTIYGLTWNQDLFIVHNFWVEESDTDVYRLQSILFMKNIAITGGLLITATHTSGKYRLRRLFATTNV